MDLLVGICLLPLLRFHMRYRVSPQVIATDASETGFGVVRSSTLTLEGSDELSLRALSTAAACDQLGIIELNAGIGVLRRAVELLERVPGVYAASKDDPACCPSARNGVAHQAPAGRRRAVQPHCPTRSICISRHNMADWSAFAARPKLIRPTPGRRDRGLSPFLAESQAWSAQQHHTQRLQLWPTVTHP